MSKAKDGVSLMEAAITSFMQGHNHGSNGTFYEGYKG